MARRGFSLIEILFAIMLLGIGFIMISGSLVVGTVQTQTTIQNIAGDAIAKGAVKTFEAGVHRAVLATDNQVHFDGLPNFQFIQMDQISSTDNRYAWIPFYRCTDANASPPTYQVYVIATQCRNASTYPYSCSSTVTPNSTNYLTGDLTPKLVSSVYMVSPGGAAPDLILFPYSPPATPTNSAYAATGGFVIIANHPTVSCNGMIFQLGANDGTVTYNSASYTQFELVPGRDVQSKTTDPSAGAQAMSVYIVGPGLADPTSALSSTNLPTGKAQDIAVYPLPGSTNAGAIVTLQP